MKNILITMALIGGSAWSCIAQTSKTAQADSSSTLPFNGAHFSLGLDVGITVPGESKVLSGASFKYEIPFASHTLFTASAGYSFLPSGNGTKKGLSFDINEKGASYLPIKVGVKHYIANHLFIEGQVGAAIFLSGHSTTVYNRYKSAYIYSAGFGYTLSSGLELGVRYEDWRNNSKVSQPALRIAYRFK